MPHLSSTPTGQSSFFYSPVEFIAYRGKSHIRWVPCILDLSKTLSWRGVELYWRFFNYEMRWMGRFFLSVYLLGRLHSQIFKCWTIPASLGWSQLGYDRWFFLTCSWIQFASISLRIFASIFIEDFSLSFSFLVDESLCDLGISLCVV